MGDGSWDIIPYTELIDIDWFWKWGAIIFIYVPTPESSDFNRQF